MHLENSVAKGELTGIADSDLPFALKLEVGVNVGREIFIVRLQLHPHLISSLYVANKNIFKHTTLRKFTIDFPQFLHLKIDILIYFITFISIRRNAGPSRSCMYWHRQLPTRLSGWKSLRHRSSHSQLMSRQLLSLVCC